MKFPRVVVNVPPSLKSLLSKSMLPAVMVTPSLVNELPLPVMSEAFHVTVVVVVFDLTSAV